MLNLFRMLPFAFVVLGLLCYSSVSVASFERLFTTSEQRKDIDSQRTDAKRQAIQGTSLSQSSSAKAIVFEAMIKSELGYTLWINGRQISKPISLFGINIDPKQINVTELILKTPKGIRKVGLGQVYWVDQDKVLEYYERPQ